MIEKLLIYKQICFFLTKSTKIQTKNCPKKEWKNKVQKKANKILWV